MAFVMVFRLARLLELLACRRPADFERMWRLGVDPDAAEQGYLSLAGWNSSSDFLEIAEHLVVQTVDGDPVE